MDCVISMEYNGIIFSNKREQTTGTHSNMDESIKYYILFTAYLNHIISQDYKQITTNKSQSNLTIFSILRPPIYTNDCIIMQTSNFVVIKSGSRVVAKLIIILRCILWEK